MAEKKTVVSLAEEMLKKPSFTNFSFWVVGDTPLIPHAWSEKARREMLGKQLKSVKGTGKEARDPEQDFQSSLYEMGNGKYGFPAMGIKNCLLSAAHKDKGIPRTAAMAALWINADMVRIRPALANAICDMPLVRVYGTKPEMREDMVKIGTGMNKVANLSYRGQFTHWGMKVTGRFNNATLSGDSLAFLVQEAGYAYGLGEWRNERKGMFGAFHMATQEEEVDWEKFAKGKGALPGIEFAEAAE